MSLKDRRKALGWSRRDLAQRAGIDHRVVQLAELDLWTETEALGRIEFVLKSAEAGELDVRLSDIKAPEGAVVAGAEVPAAPDPAQPLRGVEPGEA